MRTVWRGLLLAAAVLAASPASVAAECEAGAADAWPAFSVTAPYAASVVVGHVDAYLWVEQGGNVTRFRLAVDEVLRGAAPASIEFWVPITPPMPTCASPPLSVEMGDVLALALRSSDAVDPAVVAVAIVDDATGSVVAHGPERLTLTQVRTIATERASPWPPLFLVAALLGVFLIRPSRRWPPHTTMSSADG